MPGCIGNGTLLIVPLSDGVLVTPFHDEKESDGVCSSPYPVEGDGQKTATVLVVVRKMESQGAPGGNSFKSPPAETLRARHPPVSIFCPRVFIVLCDSVRGSLFHEFRQFVHLPLQFRTPVDAQSAAFPQAGAFVPCLRSSRPPIQPPAQHPALSVSARY